MSQSTTKTATTIQIRFMIAMDAWNKNQSTARMIATTSNV